MVAVLSTIEKRFKFTSKETGEYNVSISHLREVLVSIIKYNHTLEKCDMLLIITLVHDTFKRR